MVRVVQEGRGYRGCQVHHLCHEAQGFLSLLCLLLIRGVLALLVGPWGQLVLLVLQHQ